MKSVHSNYYNQICFPSFQGQEENSLHESEEPQESFDVDVVYTIKQEEMRDARMQESSTVGRNVPQVNINKYPQTITKFIFNIVSFFGSERIFSSIS